MAVSKKEEQKYAQLLYVNENLTFKEIAQRVGVSERTISRWSQAGNWVVLRKSMLVTKQNQITMLYNQLDALNTAISEKEVKAPDSKEADIIAKITNSIQRLEVETSVGQVVEVGKQFIDFVRDYDLKLAQQITQHFDSFILHKMK